MTEFLRQSFLPKDGHEAKVSHRRVYISRARAGYRRVLNEEGVVNLLRRRGFEVLEMEGLSVQEQAAAMASCEAVVAPRRRFEQYRLLFTWREDNRSLLARTRCHLFWKISNQLHLDYYYLLGKGHPATFESNYPQSWDARSDIEVDLGVLERTFILANVN